MSKLQNIIKWLYLNESGYSSMIEWRENFIKMLESELEGEQFSKEEGLKVLATSPVHKSAEKFVKEVEETNLITKLLAKLPACDGKDYIAKAEDTFKSWIDGDFKNWGLDKAGSKTKETLLEVREITENGTFNDIFGSLGEDLDKLVMTQSQIISFCGKHPTLLRQEGYATFFLIKENDEYFVVDVDVNSDGLYAGVGRLEDDRVWDGVYRHRLVVPQLVA